MKTVDLVPEFSERLRAGRRKERFYGASDLPNFYRKPYGQGWALVGDAGCHKDPYMALGISDALRDADLLATAIVDGLGGRRALHDALADYERQRNETSDRGVSAESERGALRPAASGVPADSRGGQNRNPAQVTRFTMAGQGMIDKRGVSSMPENLQRLLGAAT